MSGDTKLLQTARTDLSLTLMQRIDAIDLTMVKMKLRDLGEGEGWSIETCEMVEKLYRRFLYLTISRGDVAIVPSKTIDKMWHAHILDTRAYAEDCMHAFGSFLHHFPYFGLRGTKDRENLARAFAKTREIYEATFGEPYHLECGEGTALCTGACNVNGGCSNCGSNAVFQT